MDATLVVIADAQYLFAESLATALTERAGLKVVPDHPNRGSDVLTLVASERPDVALVDYWLPDMDGPSVIGQLRARAPATKVITLSWFHGRREVQQALHNGAVGFLPKGVRVDQVAEAIARAQDGEDPVFAEELTKLVRTITARNNALGDIAQRFAVFTPRELDVLQLIAAGLSARMIARRLDIREATVRTHITRILAKTEAGSQLEVVAMARDQGLVH